MSFPRIVFGKCPVCGGDGSGSQPTDADSEESVAGNGYALVLFRGDYMCQLCKERKLMDEESLRMAEINNDNEAFRSRAGFQNTI